MHGSALAVKTTQTGSALLSLLSYKLKNAGYSLFEYATTPPLLRTQNYEVIILQASVVLVNSN